METRVLLCFVMLAFASGQEDDVYDLWSERGATDGGSFCYKGMCVKHCSGTRCFCYSNVQCNSYQDCFPPPSCSSICDIPSRADVETPSDDE